MSVTEETAPRWSTSRSARRIRRFLTRFWQALVVGAVVTSMGVLALLSPGLVQADVRLDEGTVHVAKQDAGRLGVLNAQIDELSNVVPIGDQKLRVLQDEEVTLVHGAESAKLMEYDPVRNRMGKPVELPSTANVQLTGGSLLVVNPDNGKVWFGEPSEILESNFQEQKAHLEVGEFGTATLTSSGEVIGLDAQRSMLVRPGDGEPVEVPLPFRLDPGALDVDLSAVGEKAVVLDRRSGRIWVEGMARDHEVSGASGALLMEPAPDALGGEGGAKAIYATQAGLIALTNDGPRSLTGNLDATPHRPVQAGACVHGAFGEQYTRVCRDQEPLTRDLLRVPGGADLVFQANRSTIVLNDVVSGVAWMVSKDMERVDDWERVSPPDDGDDDDQTGEETVVQPQREEENRPPVAQDDDLAARAGRSTILNVLDNDSDPDGDVLTISVTAELPGAELQVIRGGTGLQITIDPDATGQLQFPYTIDDGRGEQDTAQVTVRILPADPAESNEAPFKHKRAVPMRVQLGETLTKNVLLDWRDPDGDILFLVAARPEGGVGDEVSFTPDGDVTFRDVGKTSGLKKVFVTVSDGYLDVTGEMLVEVIDDIVAPIAHGDFETTTVGKPIHVYPLANDVGNNLSLMDVDDTDCGCTITRNYQQQRFTFTAEWADSYYIPYKVSNGTTTTGVVRIDVREESTNTPPVAALDVALLPPDGSVMIDPLLNDTDADGDVLVVRSVSQAPGLKVTLQRRHLVTIEAQHRLTDPVTLTYRVSDGKHLVDGTIIVVPTRDPGSPEPQAEPDAVRIRAGATQSIDVLANDTSPIGLDLSLHKLIENPLGEDRAWIDGDRLRVAVPAGRQAGDITIVYQIEDSAGLVASSTVTITVVSEDAENEAPTPRPVVERVLAGTTTRLIIPMDGIDPNGDAVRLVGLGSGPSLGRVLSVGDGWLTYEAFPQSKGTDVFSYQVVDALGLVGTGEVRVGIAPLERLDNSPPTGVTDEIEVRPGRHVQIPALRNDVDIDGDAIGYVDSDPVQIDGIEDIEIIENRDISFVAPEEPRLYTGTYWIQDARGAQGSGELRITVSEDAPLLPPEPRDDIVPVSAVVGVDWVDVDVTANDVDPDGRQEDLRVELPRDGAPDDEEAEVAEDGRTVKIKVLERMQQVRYTAVDLDGNRANAVVLVPGRNDSVPVLADEGMQLEVEAGQVLPIDINSHIKGTAGRTVRLTSADKVFAVNGTAWARGENIEFEPESGYDGPAAVVFEVRDDTTEDDETGRSAYISIPVEVTPAPDGPGSGNDKDADVANSPPEYIGEGFPVLRVGPDEGDARLDLQPLFEDADGDEFAFEEFSHASGDKSIEWHTSSDGNKLFASAPITALPDTSRMLNGEVIDANGGSTTFQVELRVVSSTRPLATTVTDPVDALAGEEKSVWVLKNDKSNLLNDTSLYLQPDVVVNGSGTARVEGDIVKVTPAADFVGEMTVSYTVMDATLDPDRRVGGSIRVTVKARPGRPGAPRDGVTGNGTVTFTYTPGMPNGFEILSRQVHVLTESGGEIPGPECQSTTCTVTGLPNGKPYRFQVTETNFAGKSDRSPESAVYIPDVKPSPPAKPEVRFGDEALTVDWLLPTWENPANPGSKVDGYDVELLDENGSRIGLREGLPAGPLTLTWTGLTNGKNYRFRVRAGNRAGKSPFSEASNAEYPAGPPGAPGSISAAPTETALGGAFVVEFAAAGVDNNGDAISEFLVTPVNRSGGDAVAKARSVAFNGAATQRVTMEGLGEHYYRFKVQAKNKAGLGTPATTAEWQVAWGLPKLSNVTASTGQGYIQLLSSDNFSDRPQANPVKEYRLDNGNWRPLPGDGRITGLTDGKAYRAELRLRIDGPRYSETKVFDGLRPRTDAPVWPEFDPARFHYKGSAGLVVVLDGPTDLRASGGWDPAQYQYRCERHCSSNAWTGADSFNVPGDPPGGTTIQVTIRHGGHQGTQTRQHTLKAPYTASWDRGSRSFSFALNYVAGAECTLSAAVEDGVADHTQVFRQGGGSSLSGNATLPEGVNPRTVSLTCRTLSFQETFEIRSQ